MQLIESGENLPHSSHTPCVETRHRFVNGSHFSFPVRVEPPGFSFLMFPLNKGGEMRAEKVPELQTAGSTVINGKLMLTMDPLPGDLRRLMAQFVFLEIDCIRVDRFWGGANSPSSCLTFHCFV